MIFCCKNDADESGKIEKLSNDFTFLFVWTVGAKHVCQRLDKYY